jgi:hypothetical protein
MSHAGKNCTEIALVNFVAQKYHTVKMDLRYFVHSQTVTRSLCYKKDLEITIPNMVKSKLTASILKMFIESYEMGHLTN